MAERGRGGKGRRGVAPKRYTLTHQTQVLTSEYTKMFCGRRSAPDLAGESHGSTTVPDFLAGLGWPLLGREGKRSEGGGPKRMGCVWRP